MQVAAYIGHCLDVIRVQDRGNLDAQKVNQAYRKRALELHSDKHQGASDYEINNLNKMFGELGDAKDFLLSQVRPTRQTGFLKIVSICLLVNISAFCGYSYKLKYKSRIAFEIGSRIKSFLLIQGKGKIEL